MAQVREYRIEFPAVKGVDVCMKHPEFKRLEAFIGVLNSLDWRGIPALQGSILAIRCDMLEWGSLVARVAVEVFDCPLSIKHLRSGLVAKDFDDLRLPEGYRVVESG